MSYMSAAPENIASAATSLERVGSTLNLANLTAAVATTGVVASGADEVSAAIAALFGSHGRAYQALGAQVSEFHDQFVRTLTSAAHSYALAESANASPMQSLLDTVNASTQALFHRPLIGNGLDGTAASPN